MMLFANVGDGVDGIVGAENGRASRGRHQEGNLSIADTFVDEPFQFGWNHLAPVKSVLLYYSFTRCQLNVNTFRCREH